MLVELKRGNKMKQAIRLMILGSAFVWMLSLPLAELHAQSQTCACAITVRGYIPLVFIDPICYEASDFISQPGFWFDDFSCQSFCGNWAASVSPAAACGVQCERAGFTQTTLSWSYQGAWFRTPGGMGSMSSGLQAC